MQAMAHQRLARGKKLFLDGSTRAGEGDQVLQLQC